MEEDIVTRLRATQQIFRSNSLPTWASFGRQAEAAADEIERLRRLNDLLTVVLLIAAAVAVPMLLVAIAVGAAT
jgi:hypothetical protein